MRGKKFGDYDQINGLSNGNSIGNGFDNNNKRAPSGFMGMRGKKSSVENFDGEDTDDQQYSAYDLNSFYERNEKRAPSGFMGMRGKKASNNENKMSSPFMFR